MPYNIDEQRKIELEVDSGHQPWRLEPVDVAFVEVIRYDNSIKIEDCKISNSTNTNAEVVCGNKKSYLVRLKRLVMVDDGIWTAIAIEVR